MTGALAFEYTNKDLCVAKIDQLWEDQWKRVESDGLLRYQQPRENPNCNLVRSKEGFQFAFQYLLNRGSKRRARVQFSSVNEPFSDERFHFGKINSSEILFTLKPTHRPESSATAVANVSPIEWGHFLLVPNLQKNLMQRITREAMVLAFETFLLVGKKHFRMMYNSLLGWASVNHLHFHCYEFDEELVLDNLKLVLLCADVFKTDPSYPLPAFVLKFSKETYEDVAIKVAHITDILHAHQVAHNMVITAGRCYIFPRKHADTSVVSQCVDPACVELSGQFPCKAEDEWKNLTPDKAVEMIRSVQIEADLFSRVEQDIVELSLAQNAFIYSAVDFVTDREEEPLVDFGLERLSPLDERLIQAFDAADKAGVMRYSQEKGCNPMRELKTSKGLTMVAEFNHHRGFNKRARVEVPTINQPFDREKFNFNKIAPNEILFRFRSSLNGRGIGDHLAIVNISPINWCHCLYVIEPEKCLPQRITVEAVRVAFDLMRMTRAKGFRVMFNSLWAWASVNHLHLHSMLVDKPFGMDTCPSLSWGSSKTSRVRKLSDCSHLPGYVFNFPVRKSVDQESILEEIVQQFDRAIEFFHENEIPYNCTWARGTDPGELDKSAEFIRLFLWPRASAAGWEPHPAFDNACAELEGFLPIKVKEEFDALTGDSAEALIHRAKLDEKTTVLVEEFMKKL